ncbi:hypothetical protein EDB80DRAFT_725564 [Ilyonectria destructans]|nr:hypothetical protein EDB80DRAFT_725564 [Ilyonectria destructans]
MRPTVLLSAACAGLVAAHSQAPIVPEGADWMTKHMAEEHHIAGWDANSFFALHDYDSNGRWEGSEMQRTYGLMDVSNNEMLQSRKDEVLKILLDLLDQDGDFSVTLEEWKNFIAQGKTLPDLGTGPGHHGDDEYEYEIHHWEKYHDENTKLEDLTHPEDIEHFKKHEEMEDEEDRLEALNKIPIVEANIPSKFRRSS